VQVVAELDPTADRQREAPNRATLSRLGRGYKGMDTIDYWFS